MQEKRQGNTVTSTGGESMSNVHSRLYNDAISKQRAIKTIEHNDEE